MTRVIPTKLKRYKRKTTKTTSTGEKRTYTTTQYLITLHKEAIEDQEFQEVEEVMVMPSEDYQELVSQANQTVTFINKISELESENSTMHSELNHCKAHRDKIRDDLEECISEKIRIENQGIFTKIWHKIKGDKMKELPSGTKKK